MVPPGWGLISQVLSTKVMRFLQWRNEPFQVRLKHKGRFIKCSSWACSLVPRNKARKTAMGKEGEEKERKSLCTCRERKNAEREGTKISGLYSEEPLGERKPSPWARKFRVKDWVCQPCLVTCSNWGMLVEPGGQVHFGMLNMHLSCLSLVWNPTTINYQSYRLTRDKHSTLITIYILMC